MNDPFGTIGSGSADKDTADKEVGITAFLSFSYCSKCFYSIYPGTESPFEAKLTLQNCLNCSSAPLFCNRIKILRSAFGCVHHFLWDKFTILIFSLVNWQSCSDDEKIMCGTSSGWNYSRSVRVILTSWKSLFGAATALHSSRYWAHVHSSVLLSPASPQIWMKRSVNSVAHYSQSITSNTGWGEDSTWWVVVMFMWGGERKNKYCTANKHKNEGRP